MKHKSTLFSVKYKWGIPFIDSREPHRMFYSLLKSSLTKHVDTVPGIVLRSQGIISDRVLRGILIVDYIL